jgi:hypothetical protein
VVVKGCPHLTFVQGIGGSGQVPCPTGIQLVLLSPLKPPADSMCHHYVMRLQTTNRKPSTRPQPDQRSQKVFHYDVIELITAITICAGGQGQNVIHSRKQ